MLVEQRFVNQHALANHPLKRTEYRTIVEKVRVRKVVVDPPTQVQASSGYSSRYAVATPSYSSGSSGGNSSYSAPTPSYSAPTPSPAPSTSSAS